MDVSRRPPWVTVGTVPTAAQDRIDSIADAAARTGFATHRSVSEDGGSDGMLSGFGPLSSTVRFPPADGLPSPAPIPPLSFV